MSVQQTRVPQPPSSVTGDLGRWLQTVWEVLNQTPQMSHFSGTTPVSSVTGVAGDLAVNIGAASTSSRLWVKGGSAAVPDQSNWAQVKVVP